MHPDLFTIPGTNIVIPGYGAAVVVAFLLTTLWTTRRAAKVKADQDVILNIALMSLIFGWIGGRTFYVLHYWKTQFAHDPGQVLNFAAGGFEVYGGLIGAFLPAYVYVRMKGLSRRLYADLVAPGLALGLGIGRLGCFMYGCCWGGQCDASLPWAVRFPAPSPVAMRHWEDRLVTMPASLIFCDPGGISRPVPRALLKLSREQVVEKGEALEKKLPELESALKEKRATLEEARSGGGDVTKAERQVRRAELAVEQGKADIDGLNEFLAYYDRFDVNPPEALAWLESDEFRSRPVHPAQIYSFIGPALLALLASTYFYRRKRHGMVAVMVMGLYAIERFIEEIVRTDNPRDTFGLTISQGVSVGMLIGAILIGLTILRLPERSWRPAKLKPRKKKGQSTAPGEVEAPA